MRAKGFLRTARLVSIFSLFAIFFAACGGATTNTNLTAAPPDKQVLRGSNEGGDFDSLDPALTYNGLGDPWNIIYSGLVTPQADGTIKDQLALSHTVSSDGLTYTFKLRPNLTFSNGDPLTADDVAYSLNRVVLPATKSGVSSYLSLLKDYDKVTSGAIPTLIGDSILPSSDKTSISLVISKPAAYFLEALSYSTGDVVNRKVVDKYPTNWTDHLSEGVGSGPFKVSNYGHTTNLTLVPNPKYYGAQPKLQKIIYTMAADRDSNYKAFLAGQYDYAPVPPADNDQAAKKPGYQQVPSLALRFIGMNYLVKPLDNIKIRQALSLALDKDLLASSIIGSFVTPSNHIIPNGIPGYNSKLTGPAGVASTKGDQNKAKQLFQQGLQEEGYSSVSALPQVTLTYSKDYAAGASTMSAVANEWKQVLGFTVKMNGIPNNDLLDEGTATVGHDGPLQIWYGVWQADYPDAQDWTSLFFAKGTDHNYFNYGQNHSSAATEQQAVQTELAKADVEKDSAQRLKMYQDAEQKLINDAVWITMYQPNYIYAVNPKLQNWKLTPMGLISTDDWLTVYFTQ